MCVKKHFFNLARERERERERERAQLEHTNNQYVTPYTLLLILIFPSAFLTTDTHGGTN